MNEDIKKLCRAARRAVHDFDMFQNGHYTETMAADAINELSTALVKVEEQIR